MMKKTCFINTLLVISALVLNLSMLGMEMSDDKLWDQDPFWVSEHLPLNCIGVSLCSHIIYMLKKRDIPVTRENALRFYNLNKAGYMINLSEANNPDNLDKHYLITQEIEKFFDRMEQPVKKKKKAKD